MPYAVVGCGSHVAEEAFGRLSETDYLPAEPKVGKITGFLEYEREDRESRSLKASASGANSCCRWRAGAQSGPSSGKASPLCSGSIANIHFQLFARCRATVFGAVYRERRRSEYDLSKICRHTPQPRRQTSVVPLVED
jgi:hypothetical protein